MIFRIVLALAYVRRSLTRYAEAAAGPRLKSRIGCFLALRKSARYGRVLRGKGRRCGLGAAVWRAALKTWTLKNALHGVVIMGRAPLPVWSREKPRLSRVAGREQARECVDNRWLPRRPPVRRATRSGWLHTSGVICPVAMARDGRTDT